MIRIVLVGVAVFLMWSILRGVPTEDIIPALFGNWRGIVLMACVVLFVVYQVFIARSSGNPLQNLGPLFGFAAVVALAFYLTSPERNGFIASNVPFQKCAKTSSTLKSKRYHLDAGKGRYLNLCPRAGNGLVLVQSPTRPKLVVSRENPLLIRTQIDQIGIGDFVTIVDRRHGLYEITPNAVAYAHRLDLTRRQGVLFWVAPSEGAPPEPSE